MAAPRAYPLGPFRPPRSANTREDVYANRLIIFVTRELKSHRKQDHVNFKYHKSVVWPMIDARRQAIDKTIITRFSRAPHYRALLP